MNFVYRELSTEQLADTIASLAKLRIEIFAEYPYLYRGDTDSETEYLQHLLQSQSAFVIAAMSGNTIVGAATGMPMGDAHPQFQAAFAGTTYSPEQLYYCAESVLLPIYRGFGVGHVFFDRREAHARRLGKRYTCFCAVVRASDDPRKPPDYSPLDTFWRKRGYSPLDGATAEFAWQEHGEQGESAKTMQFWIRDLQSTF